MSPVRKGLKQNKQAPQQKPSVENFQRYEAQNKAVKKAPIAVFMGDSITDGWARQHPEFFSDNNYIGRGISGQTTCQMLARLRPDAIELKPKFIVTAPTSKEAMNLAGHNYTGQTEILEHFLSKNGERAEMLFVSKDFRVLLLTRHVPVSKVPSMITFDFVVSKIRELYSQLKKHFQRPYPKPNKSHLFSSADLYIL